jgi:hypothetical protein
MEPPPAPLEAGPAGAPWPMHRDGTASSVGGKIGGRFLFTRPPCNNRSRCYNPKRSIGTRRDEGTRQKLKDPGPTWLRPLTEAPPQRHAETTPCSHNLGSGARQLTIYIYIHISGPGFTPRSGRAQKQIQVYLGPGFTQGPGRLKLRIMPGTQVHPGGHTARAMLTELPTRQAQRR